MIGLDPLFNRWTVPDRGALFVVSGPSGSGKTTLLREALRVIPGLEFSVSATTRAPRVGEVDGVDYHYVDHDKFRSLLADNALLEHAEVYGNYYGTPRAPVEAALAEGRSIVLDIDVQGAEQVRRSHTEAVSVFILPPSLVTIERRLRGRGLDDDSIVERRVREADEQLAAAGDYDFLVLNDDLDAAHGQLQSILVAELLRRSRRESWIQAARR